MSSVSGKVVESGSGLGIGDVLVVIRAVGPSTRPEDTLARSSARTAKDGKFAVSLEDTDFGIGHEGERRPNIVLSVHAPEDPDGDADSRALYVAPVRHNAGDEQAVIRLSAERLQRAGLPLPTAAADDAEGAASVVERLKARETRQGKIDTGQVETAQQRLEAYRERVAGFEELRPQLAVALSKVSPAFTSDRFVAPGESVLAKNVNAIKRTLRDVVNAPDPAARPRVRGLVTLTREQAEQLRQEADAEGHVPTESVVAATARSDQAGSAFIRSANAWRTYAPQTDREREVAAALDPPASPPPPPPPADGDGVQVVAIGDMPRYIARLVDTMTSPEEELVTELPAATLQSARRNIRQLALEPGPTRASSSRDVYSLQIAFEHVWQEAVDEGVLDLAQNIYDDIVELGGAVKPGANPDTVGVLQASALEALRARKVIIRDHRGRPPVVPPPGRTGGGSGAPASPVERLPRLLVEMERRLRENYAFKTYAANAKERYVNFGVLLKYRVKLTPLRWEMGELVRSIPLAPGQRQQLTVTHRIHKKRAVKETERNLRSLREESTQTSRAEQEIMRRASAKTAFAYTNEATSGVEVAEVKTTTSLTREAQKSSDDIKKSMRESVVKAAMEVSREVVTEVTTEETTDFESVETTEIRNDNREVPITYLLYDANKVCRVSVDLWQAEPVILVAQEMPKPHEIDQDWLLTHDWILKRTILDDSFIPALESLVQSAGNETALADMRTNVEQQRRIVDELREELTVARRRATLQSSLIERAVYQRVGAVNKADGGLLGFVGDAVDAVTDVAGDIAGIAAEVGSRILGDGEGQENNRGAFEDAAERAADAARDLMFRLEREVTALNALTESYTKALREHHTHLTEIARTEVHVRQNITEYMKHIWEQEPDAQRINRLTETLVPVLKPRRRTMRIDFDRSAPATTALPHERLERFGGREVMVFPYESAVEMEDGDLEFEPLAKVADLGTLKGFWANCAIFPLFESNALTDFMMDPYVDRATGELLDSASPERFTLDEFADYVGYLKERLTAGEFDELRPALKEQYERLLTATRRSDDVVVIPTGSLFIEAIPATETLLEPHLRQQRMMELKQKQEQHRGQALESVRLASRLLADEREDPNIDKRILVEGRPGVVVDPENP